MICAECEYLVREPGGKGKVFYRCSCPGEKQGRVVASVPDWCTAAQIWRAPAWCGWKEVKDDAAADS